jgi:hypothetical protein
MGKGSGRRPQSVTDKQMEDAWDRIFKTTMKIRKEENIGQDKSDTKQPKEDKDRWLHDSSDS